MRLFLSGQYGSIAEFDACAAADPGFALGHAGLARARMMGGDMAGAKASIATAEQLGSSSRRSLATRRLILADAPPVAGLT